MKRYRKYIRPYIQYYILGPCFMMMEVVGDVLLPYMLAKIINQGIAERNVAYIVKIGATMGLIAVIMAVGGVLGAWFASKAAMNFGADLRMDLFEKIQQFSFQNIDNFSTGSLITRLTNDITQIQNMIMMTLRMCLRSPGILIGAMVMAFVISPKLAAIFIIVLPVLAVLIVVIMRRAFPQFRTLQEKLDALNSCIQEGLVGIRLIKSFVQIMSSLTMLSIAFLNWARAIASFRRVGEVLNEKIDLTDENAKHKDRAVCEGSVEFQNVSFRYYKNSPEWVIENISFKLEAGKTLGIIGPTGSGKSTLVSMIPRLYDTDEGTVLVDGINVRDYGLKPLREGIGMVLQNNTLFSGSITENLKWGDEHADEKAVRKAAQNAQAAGFIDSFKDGYRTRLEQSGNNVSGGQKQRLCIARALLKHPKILILDDSTSAVDMATERAIRGTNRRGIGAKAARPKNMKHTVMRLFSYMKKDVWMLAVYLLGVMAAYLQNRIMLVLSQKALVRLRSDLFVHMEKLPLRFFDTHTKGDLKVI